MTPEQKSQFNTMYYTLQSIARDYKTPEELRETSEEDYGLGYEEALEMSYENIKSDALRALHDIKPIELL